MNVTEISEACYLDRVESQKNVKTKWVRRNAFDLLVKYYIVLINTIGKRQKDFTGYLFVDEINNNSMRNNLFATKRQFEAHGEDVGMVSFYQKNETTIKRGYLRPVWDMVTVTLACIPIFIMALLGKNQTRNVINTLVRHFSRAMRGGIHPREIYLMTDHHFYSSIIAMSCPAKCNVIQHGLVMGAYFYYPVRAGRFLAWGDHSRELQHDDPKVEVVGTYKFENIRPQAPSRRFQDVMFCINSLDDDVVRRKIEVLLAVAEKENMNLMVKCHPGSFFDATQWKEQFKGRNIVFYKEELIQDLQFDFAVSENSTVILDLVAMNKPFILYDALDGYFGEYADLIPHGNSYEELLPIMAGIDAIDFSAINETLRGRELNGGKCVIYEHRKV